MHSIAYLRALLFQVSLENVLQSWKHGLQSFRELYWPSSDYSTLAFMRSPPLTMCFVQVRQSFLNWNMQSCINQYSSCIMITWILLWYHLLYFRLEYRIVLIIPPVGRMLYSKNAIWIPWIESRCLWSLWHLHSIKTGLQWRVCWDKSSDSISNSKILCTHSVPI